MPGRVAVAFSGGRDSTALLHAAAVAASPLGIAVVALHVHHGLSVHADDWLSRCEATCRRLSRRGLPVSFVSTRIESAPGAGESVEAWARRARYRALREMAVTAGLDLVLLAHHRRDQAETFLLQALRGGGVAALSAMPLQARRDGVTWARPWLDVSSTEIDRYARAHRLRWIEDDSNADTRFARNRLRHDVFPALLRAFPNAEISLAHAARWAQQAAEVLVATAAADLAEVASDRGLAIVPWRALPTPRQSLALRTWLRDCMTQAAPASLIERLMAEVGATGTRRWPAPAGELRSDRGHLRWTPLAFQPGDLNPVTMDLGRSGVHIVAGWRGALVVAEATSGGLLPTLAHRVMVRARLPGDRFQAGPKRPPRSLKLQYQAAGMPASERLAPVVCVDELVVFVPGLGIDARAIGRPGEKQWSLTWRPDPTEAGVDDVAR